MTSSDAPPNKLKRDRNSLTIATNKSLNLNRKLNRGLEKWTKSS
jgi:hypothetical protein